MASDIHLGTRGCKAGFLLDFLRCNDCDYLYLVGDIVDGWQLLRSWYWDEAHNDVVQKILRKARKGTRVICVPANHDVFARDYAEFIFGGIVVKKDAIHRCMRFLLRAATPAVNKYLRQVQFISSAGLAFSHGANDAKKSMGIITLVLLLGGFIPEFEVPFWVILACASAITLGILSGGWRIVRTVGFGIYKVRPLHAFDAQLTSAAVIFSASLLGAPVSTTHVVSSSIMGIGASERPKAVRWNKALDIVSTWVITIPGAATVSIAAFALVNLFIQVK